MSKPCPKGHPSTDPEYCSECGMRMDASSAQGAASAPANPPIGLPGEGEICPDCGTPRVSGSRFCEVCRFDFAPHLAGNPSVALAQAPAPIPISTRASTPTATPAPPVPASPPVPAAQAVPSNPSPVVPPPNSIVPSALPERLNVVVITDPTLIAEPDPAKPCPVGAPDRVFPLDLAENLVGRRSETKGIFPEVEISDPGVSHRHLKFLRRDDGSFEALDLGSANGTHFNGALLTPGVAVRVQAGDEILVGLWTRITLRSRI